MKSTLIESEIEISAVSILCHEFVEETLFLDPETSSG